MTDVWAELGAAHDLTPRDTDRARRFAARGDRVVVVESGWFHRGRYVTSRGERDAVDVIGGQVLAVYRPDGTPVTRAT